MIVSSVLDSYPDISDHSYILDISLSNLEQLENPTELLYLNDSDVELLHDGQSGKTTSNDNSCSLDLHLSDSNKETQDREALHRAKIHQTNTAFSVDMVEDVNSENVVEYEQVQVENLLETPEVVHVNEEDDLPALVGQTKPIEIINIVPPDNAQRLCKRKKRHQVNPETCKINQWKVNRKHGKEYYGKKKNNEGVYLYNMKKNSKVMKARCKCNRKNNSLLQCSALTENDRKRNFEEFWKLEWEGKKLLVKFLTRKNNASRARDRKQENKSRRIISCQYFLKKGDSINRVCKTIFLNTLLSIGEWTALQWQRDSDNRQDEAADEHPLEDNGRPNDTLAPSKKLRKSPEVCTSITG